MGLAQIRVCRGRSQDRGDGLALSGSLLEAAVVGKPSTLLRRGVEAPAHLIAAQPGYDRLVAARAGRVFVADGNLYFNRSSPSLFETPEILAEMLHPAVFESRHEGTAWRRYAGG